MVFAVASFVPLCYLALVVPLLQKDPRALHHVGPPTVAGSDGGFLFLMPMYPQVLFNVPFTLKLQR